MQLSLTHTLIHRGKFFLNKALDLLLPRNCISCGVHGNHLCASCAQTLPRALPDERDLIACFEYNDATVRRALWKFKYAGAKDLAEIFADCLAEELLGALAELPSPPEEGEVVALVPVPLHPKRARERGYNQAQVLAQILAQKVSGTQCFPSFLIRKSNTASQTMMKTRADREKNMKNVFVLAEAGRAPRIAVIIDDIITSGATTRACAAVLKSAGATTILRAAVAHGTF